MHCIFEGSVENITYTGKGIFVFVKKMTEDARKQISTENYLSLHPDICTQG